MDFHKACLKGDLRKVKWYTRICRSKSLWDGGLSKASEGGHLEIVHLLIYKGATNWNGGLLSACQAGHLPIAQLMVDKGATNWNRGLSNACSGGHMELVQLMIEKGANEWEWALYKASVGGHLKIVALLLDIGAYNFVAFCSLLLPDQQLQVYNLVTKDKVRLKLEQHSPVIKERLRLTTIIVLNDRLPDHLIRTIVMEYL